MILKGFMRKSEGDRINVFIKTPWRYFSKMQTFTSFIHSFIPAQQETVQKNHRPTCTALHHTISSPAFSAMRT